MTVDKKAFRALTSGLSIVSACDDAGCNVGCVINTLVQVASEPPTLSIALNKQNATTKAVQQTGAFAATVLGQTATMELIGLFGFKSSTEVDKFAGCELRTCGEGLPLVTDHGVACFTVRVEHTVDAGSHLVFIGPVQDAEVLAEGEPMSYAYYHGVLRGKTPPKAASYSGGDDAQAPAVEAVSAEAAAEGEAAAPGQVRYGWQCTLCGYIEEGYPDGLPADYTCPICGVGPDMFERIEL